MKSNSLSIILTSLLFLVYSCDESASGVINVEGINSADMDVTGDVSDVTPLMATFNVTVRSSTRIESPSIVQNVSFYVTPFEPSADAISEGDLLYSESFALEDSPLEVERDLEISRFELGKEYYFRPVISVIDRNTNKTIRTVFGRVVPFQTADPDDYIETMEPQGVSEVDGVMVGRIKAASLKRLKEQFPDDKLIVQCGILYSSDKNEIDNHPGGISYENGLDFESDSFYPISELREWESTSDYDILVKKSFYDEHEEFHYKAILVIQCGNGSVMLTSSKTQSMYKK